MTTVQNFLWNKVPCGPPEGCGLATELFLDGGIKFMVLTAKCFYWRKAARDKVGYYLKVCTTEILAFYSLLWLSSTGYIESILFKQFGCEVMT